MVGVDIDGYIARNEPGWRRLDELTRRARRRVSSLAPQELDELVQRYQHASAQLSYVRTYYRDPSLTARLTRLVAAASGVIYGKRTRSARAIGTFFGVSFPAAVWHQRRAIVVAAVLFVLPAVLVGLWLVNDPVALDASGSPGERRHYVEEQFEQYYSDQPSAQFFTQVTTNNIRVAFTAFALGGLLAVPGALILGFNAVALGQAAAWMISEGDSLRFWGLILPHGALEITAIVVAAGAGFAVGWAVIAPGDRTRAQAIREEGRRAVVIVLGLMAAFLAAGLIEGFVTGSGLAPAARIAVGVGAWVAFVAYLWVYGRAAAARGFTGALGENDRPPLEPLEPAGETRAVARVSPASS
jgi:uncharacterized membrane protein SpoIIM required for sporulation